MTKLPWRVTAGRTFRRPEQNSWRRDRLRLSNSRPVLPRLLPSFRSIPPGHTLHFPLNSSIMSDQVQELLNVPREFLKDGMMFINRSQKREFSSPPFMRPSLTCH